MVTRKRAVLATAVVALVGAAGISGFARTSEPAVKQATTQVATARQQDLSVVAEASGEVEPIREVEVKSKASGEVLKIYVETGDYVEQGTLLAEIDPRDVQNTLDQAAADLESARVQASTTTANRERMETLRQANAVTQQEYESAVQSAAAARTAVVRAETNLRLAQEERKDVTIRAPISGTILSRTVEPGQIVASATKNVSGGNALFTMADLRDMQVRTLVDETDIGQIEAGQKATVTVEAYPGRTFTGEVLKIEPQAVVDQNVTTFPVLVHLANPDELLKPGMNADVTVQVASRTGVVAIPSEAELTPQEAEAEAGVVGLSRDAVRSSLGAVAAQGAGNAGNGQHGAVVFVRDTAGTTVRRVVLGLSDGEYTEVVSGLKPGEKVVTASASAASPASGEAKSTGEAKGAPGAFPGMGGGMRRGG
jgi:HlyD family secretion protein